MDATSTRMMDRVLSSIEDVVWSISVPGGRLLYLNDAAERLTGRPVRHFVADPQRWLDVVHPEDRAAMQRAEEQAIATGSYETTFRIIRADGTTREVLVRAWAAHDENGEAVRLEGIFSDITERRRADVYRELAELKSHFIATVAHELNNVVAPMELNLDLVLRDVPADEANGARRAGERLHRALGRLDSFLADLLDAARLEGGRLVLRRALVDADAVVHDVVEEWTERAARRGVRLHVEGSGARDAMIDAERFRQVAANLVGNAIKFTPQGGKVRVEYWGGEDEIELRVEDTGVGIAKEDVDKLFLPFSQLAGAPQERRTGTGLGLYLTRGIVEAHGGRVWCESQGAGKGATFVVRLPRRQ